MIQLDILFVRSFNWHSVCSNFQIFICVILRCWSNHKSCNIYLVIKIYFVLHTKMKSWINIYISYIFFLYIYLICCLVREDLWVQNDVVSYCLVLMILYIHIYVHTYIHLHIYLHIYMLIYNTADMKNLYDSFCWFQKINFKTMAHQIFRLIKWIQ